MRKVLVVIIYLQITNICLGQFSLDFTAGLGEMRRDIPQGYLSKTFKGSLELSLNYKFDSIPLEFNITPYLINGSRYEQFPNGNNIVADYSPKFVLMAGIGTTYGVERFVQVFASLQFGYWHTQTWNYINYGYTNTTDIFEKDFNQFAIGPKFKIMLGKKRLKTLFTYEDYFLSASPGSRFGKDRFTSCSVGISYNFENRK